MERNSNPLQQKTFSNKVTTTKQNISLQQKTFTNVPVAAKQSGKLHQKTQNMGTLVANKKAKTNSKNRNVLNINSKILKALVTVFVGLLLAYFDYRFLVVICGFGIKTKADLIYSIIILATSVISAIMWFFAKIKETEGVILKYLIAIIFGVIGNALGFVSSLIFCIFIYDIGAIGKFFFG